MGMFLGMSVITLGEIFIFFVKGIWGALNKNRRDMLTAREIEASTQTDGELPSYVKATHAFMKPMENSNFGGAYNTLYAAHLEDNGNLPAGTVAVRDRLRSL